MTFLKQPTILSNPAISQDLHKQLSIHIFQCKNILDKELERTPFVFKYREN